jgi:DNA helicase-2/ATP-dependent DNA helicase PcrA
VTDLLKDLTPPQKDAVTHGDGPLLVLAGAGSGKTRVITRRVAYLIEQRQVEPRSILAITFTNKASGEMRERIAQLTSGARVQVSTFHAFCARTLRRFATRVGYRQDFTILDDADQQAAAREALVETANDPKLWGVPKVLHAIERLKDQVILPPAALAAACSPFEKAVAEAYGYYQDLLRQNNALDFGDLLARTVELLDIDDVRGALQDRYAHVLIDEYQDTNHAQYVVAKRLTEGRRNLCATGDPNQAIYGWRGADITNILRFEEDYPDARVVKLEENFRSTRMILTAANGIIAHNKERRDTELRVGIEGEDEGAPLEVKICHDEQAEGRYVARCVQERILDGVTPREVAVFFRANALSRAIEVALLERGVPFEVVGAVPFFQRKEIKDLLAYLRLVTNPRDDLALQRVANVPPRGLGKTTLSRVKAAARAEGTSLVETAERLALSGDLRGRQRDALRELTASLRRLAGYAAGEPSVSEILRMIIAETRYREFLIKEYPEDGDDRLMNLESLIGAAREFDLQAGVTPGAGGAAAWAPAPASSRGDDDAEDEEEEEEDDADLMPLFGGRKEREAPPPPMALPAPSVHAAPTSSLFDDDDEQAPARGPAGFLEHVALVSSLSERDDSDPKERVQLMTVHAAKGLEFDTVFVTGLEEGVFPNSRALEDGRGLEEERRLAYVAVTRARRRLVLTRSNWRTRQGRSTPQQPSMFLLEVPQEVFPAGESPRDLELSFQLGDAQDAQPGWGFDSPRAQRRFGGAQARRRNDDDRGDEPPDDDVADFDPALFEDAGGAGRRVVRDADADPGDDVEPGDRGGGRGRVVGYRSLPGGRAPERRTPASPPLLRTGPLGVRVPAAATPRKTSELDVEFKEGDRVVHEHFGRGVVIGVKGRGVTARVKVDFPNGLGVKDLVLQYARMTKL